MIYNQSEIEQSYYNAYQLLTGKTDYDKFSYQIYSKVDNEYHLIKGGSCDQEYEEAELECLKELIEIVKNLKQQ